MPEEEIQVEPIPEEEQEVSLEETGLEPPKEEVVDPGQLEGKEKPRPQDNEPGPDTPRFKKVYARLKGAEETIEKLKGKDAENAAVMEEVRKHNAALMDKIEKLSNKAIDAVESSRQPSGDPPEIVTVRQTISDLEARKEEAVENLKGKEVVQIDRELRKLERVLEGYEIHKSREAEFRKHNAASRKPEKEEPKATADPDIEEFVKQTKEWYGKDPIMTGAANEYELYLSTLPEWKSKPFSDRLKKVKEDIEGRFGMKSESKPKPPGAESGIGLQKPPGSLGGVKTVKLSAAEIAVANGLGITPEAYAKQKQFLGGAI